MATAPALARGETRNDVVDAPGSRFHTATRISRLRARALLSAGRRALPSLGSRGARALLAHESATPNTAAGLPPRPRVAGYSPRSSRYTPPTTRAGLAGAPRNRSHADVTPRDQCRIARRSRRHDPARSLPSQFLTRVLGISLEFAASARVPTGDGAYLLNQSNSASGGHHLRSSSGVPGACCEAERPRRRTEPAPHLQAKCIAMRRLELGKVHAG